MVLALRDSQSGVGKQMEEQISSSGLSYNNTGDESANSKFLKCNDSRSRSLCREAGTPRGGSVFDSLTLLTKIHSVPSTC